ALFPDSPEAREARKALPHVPARLEIRRIEQAMLEGIDTPCLPNGHSVSGENRVMTLSRPRRLIRLGLLYESVGDFARARDTYGRVKQELQAGQSSVPGADHRWLADLSLMRQIVARGRSDSAAALDELADLTGPDSRQHSAYLAMALGDLKTTLEKKHYVRRAERFTSRYPHDIAGFDLLLNSVDILVEDGLFEDALARMAVLLERYPGVPGARDISLRRCRLEEENERFQTALTHYLEHMDRYGYTSDLALWVADLAVDRLTDPETALVILKKSLESGVGGVAGLAVEKKIARLESYAIVEGLENMARRYGDGPSAPGFLMSAAGIKTRLALPGEAVEFYMKVADEYPTSPLAPKALWEAALLLEKTFDDKSGAVRLYRRLTGDYRDHPLVKQAEPRMAALEAVEVVAEAPVEVTDVTAETDIKALQERMELDLERSLTGQAATMEKALSWTDLSPAEKQWLHLQLADIYQRELEQYEQAAVHLRQVLLLTTRESRKKTFLLRLADLHEAKLGNYTDAAAQLQVYIEEFPADPEAARICFHLGEIYELRLGEYERARLYYERVINSFMDSNWVDDALFRLAGNYEKHFRDFETALDLYQDLIDRYIDSPWADDAQYRRGVIYEQYLREYEAAIVEYERVSLNYSSSSWERLAQDAISRLEGKF
ncbi:MAG: tetratricopeptide repeat protein, partial [Gemmatimonadota bacterium]|nr:tetratricopeptide repeat protein [Gemmatimonadota bacterium]